jgi:DNA-binding GntR family transcriptional regulator
VPIPSNCVALDRSNARQLVAESLREWIVSGVLEPGEILKDVEISRSFGVSRTPVREAFLELEQEGLIETSPSRWTRVAALDPAKARKLYEVLVDLEVLSSRLAALRAVQHMDQICRAQNDFKQAVLGAKEPSNSELVRLRRLDDAFHGAILTAADNEYLSNTLRWYKTIALRYEQFYSPTITRDSVSEHELIVAALRQGDAETAASATRRNWHRAFTALDELIDPPESSSGANKS